MYMEVCFLYTWY